jgi:transcriptional regulator with XRE-family HTH domain
MPGTTSPLGSQIRVERARRGWSLDELAQRSGLSRGWIGRVERGSVMPTIRVVGQIADALGVTVTTLLGDDSGAEEHGPPTPQAAVVRRAQRAALRFPGSQHFYEILTPNLRGQLQALHVEIPPGEPEPIDYFEHAGEELFYVLAGRVTLEFEDSSVELGLGDAITIASRHRHRLVNQGDATAVVLTVASPPFL